MWTCMFCVKKEKRIACCGKQMCENSSARFTRPEEFWEHLKVAHPKEFTKMTKYEKA